MPDIPYQPVIRDRGAERARLDQVPGYSQARLEAAVRMGTTHSAISRLEGSRKHLLALSTLRRYADVLGCDVDIWRWRHSCSSSSRPSS